MRRTLTSCVTAFVVLAVLVSSAPATVTTERIATGLASPTYCTHAPGDPTRLYILEQRGTIRILDLETDTLNPGFFLDIRSRVNDSGDEQGLLGLAFDPEFQQTGEFYVYFTNSAGPAGSTVIRRFNTITPDDADENSIFKIWVLQQPFTNHNGGMIEFGPDGYLYVGVGDGGSGGDPQNFAQTTTTQLGKMLRIDPEGDDFPADTLSNYAIPPDNPFVGDASTLDEIWAIGVRNPWRFSFDRQNGDMYIADVGQNCWEEVNYEKAGSGGGKNYGWVVREGMHCYAGSNCFPPGTCPGPYTDPVWEYQHSGGGFCWSITGGYVYRGLMNPLVRGEYFVADYCTEQIWSFEIVGGAAVNVTNRTVELDPPGSVTIDDITSFGEDANGELYIVERGSRTSATGELFRMIPDASTVDVPVVDRPSGFRISDATPNPFRGFTVLDLQIDRRADLDVAVYDTAGRLVRKLHSGTPSDLRTSLEWDGRDEAGNRLAAGVYFVRAELGGRVESKTVTLVR